jgi:predicted membrane protein
VTVFAQGAGDGALWGVVLALAALALLFRVPRRLVTAVLIVLLAVLAFETGVHAVHHIGDGRTTARCPVASMAPHLGGTTVTPATSGLALQPSVDGVVVTDALVPVLRSLGPAQGRSPPSLAS